MQLATVDIAQKFLPEKLSGKIKPGLDKLDVILFGQDENATSQRMALMVFAIRVASAAIALVSQILLARWMGAAIVVLSAGPVRVRLDLCGGGQLHLIAGQ